MLKQNTNDNIFEKGVIAKSKNWYYLGAPQTYKVELANIVFGYKPINFAVKSSTQRFD